LVRAGVQGKQQNREEEDREGEWAVGATAGRLPTAYALSVALLFPMNQAFPVSRGDVLSAVLLWHDNSSILNSVLTR